MHGSNKILCFTSVRFIMSWTQPWKVPADASEHQRVPEDGTGDATFKPTGKWSNSSSNTKPSPFAIFGSGGKSSALFQIRSKAEHTNEAVNRTGWGVGGSHATEEWKAEKETKDILENQGEDDDFEGLPDILNPRNTGNLFVKGNGKFNVPAFGFAKSPVSETTNPAAKEAPKEEVQEEPKAEPVPEPEPEPVSVRNEEKPTEESDLSTEGSPKTRIRVKKRVRKTPKQSAVDLRFMEFKQGMKGPLTSVLPSELASDEEKIDEMLAKLYLTVPAWMKCPSPIIAPRTGFFPMLMNEQQMRKFQELFKDDE